jgi:hypothetical protein
VLHNLPKMVSYGVASATDPVGIECGGVSTGCESGGASFGSEYGGASAGSEFGGASAGTATVGTLTVGDVAVPASTCWSYVLRPQLGLFDTEGILHGGALPVPVFLDGSESSVMTPYQTVLRGGCLHEPHLFSDLEVVNGLQFITLDKTSDGLCQYLTGRKAKAYPLKDVDFFDYMQKSMHKHCDGIMAEHKRRVEAAMEQQRGEAATAQAAQMGKIVSKTANPKKREGFGRESHKKRVLNALPPVGAVNMSHGATEWHPVCVIRTGTKNVAMQSTTDNFTKLFEIVRKCLAGLKETGAQTPVRKLRRRKSNPHAPKGPPDEREYFCQSKGIWITKTRKEEDTTPGGSGKCQKAGANRRFRKSPTGNPVISRIGLRPGNHSEKRRWKPIPNRGQRVLGDNDDKDDDGSSSHDMFAA